MNEALLIAFRDSRAKQLYIEEEAVRVSLNAMSRRLQAEKEAESRLLALHALAYMIDRRWQEYRSSSLGEFAASRISDADYIEAMFQHYSLGKKRVL